jgi:hypothetical protein
MPRGKKSESAGEAVPKQAKVASNTKLTAQAFGESRAKVAKDELSEIAQLQRLKALRDFKDEGERKILDSYVLSEDAFDEESKFITEKINTLRKTIAKLSADMMNKKQSTGKLEGGELAVYKAAQEAYKELNYLKGVYNAADDMDLINKMVKQRLSYKNDALMKEVTFFQ